MEIMATFKTNLRYLNWNKKIFYPVFCWHSNELLFIKDCWNPEKTTKVFPYSHHSTYSISCIWKGKIFLLRKRHVSVSWMTEPSPWFAIKVAKHLGALIVSLFINVNSFAFPFAPLLKHSSTDQRFSKEKDVHQYFSKNSSYNNQNYFFYDIIHIFFENWNKFLENHGHIILAKTWYHEFI